MTNVTIYCERAHMEAVLKKIEERLAEPVMVSNPLQGKSRESLQAVLWDRVEKEVGNYLKGQPDDIRDIVDHAFVFANPLNDSVFMLTPVGSAAGALHEHTFEAGPLPPRSHRYSIDFYERI